MIINFAKEIENTYTDSQRRRLEELEAKDSALDETYRKKYGKEFSSFLRDYYVNGETVLVEGWKEDYFKEREKLISIDLTIWKEALSNYKKEKQSKGVLSDVIRIIEAYTKEDFIKYIQNFREVFSYSLEERISPVLEELSEESFNNCYYHFMKASSLSEALEILDREDRLTALEVIRSKIAQWYVEPESAYLPILKGKATDVVKLGVKSSLLEDKIAHTVTLKVIGEDSPLEATIRKFDEYRAKLDVGTDQLLNVAIAKFTNSNHIGEDNNRILKTTEIRISLKEYAKSKKIDIETHSTFTPEDKKREAERVKKALKRVRKSAEEELEALATIPLSWGEKVRGKREDFIDVYLIEAKAIIDGYIYIKFTPSYASYLLRLPVNFYPMALLSLDPRQSNAYMIGKKLASHFFMDSNQLHNRAQLLKVKTILKETDLPTIEEVRANRYSWVARIKEPLESALDALGGDYIAEVYNKKTKKREAVDREGCGLLEDWEYTHSKGVPLTDKEASELINDYEVWADTLIKFTPKDAPNQTERLEKKRTKIEKAKRKKQRKRARPIRKKTPRGTGY